MYLPAGGPLAHGYPRYGALCLVGDFGRKIAARSKCQLDLSRQYSLIYADLGTEDAQGWNVLAELNKAFDIKLPAEYLRVMDAGFFTFSHFGNGAVPPNTSLDKIFPQSPVPLSVSRATEPMTNTAGFWLTVSLDDIKLFGSLIEIGYASPSGDGDKLSLSAVLARGTVAGKAVSDAIYLASLPSFRLFKLFGFEEVEVRYRFKEARQLNVKGKLRVSLFDEKQYLFEGVLNSDEVNRTFSACLKSAEPDQSVTRLFGDQMRGITFQRLVFGIFARYGDNEDQRTFQVQGTVRVGSAQLTGYIYLHNGKPQVASIKVDKALSIGDVFNQCIPGPRGRPRSSTSPSRQAASCITARPLEANSQAWRHSHALPRGTCPIVNLAPASTTRMGSTSGRCST
ncbi:hypothetical protein NWF32_24550 [Pseudomonas qingdaonensis]|nr:hypothetical protein [Pseudomonas qingdaonensis]